VVINPRIRRIAAGIWRLEWSTDQTPPITFRVYRDGLLIAQTEATSLTVAIAQDEAPVFEILDADEGDPQRGYPSKLVLGWYAEAEPASYTIQEERGSGNWVDVDSLVNDGRTPYFTFTTRPLEDGEEHAYRIIPVGVNGNAGTALEIATLLVRTPTPPTNISFAYAAGDVTVAMS
jgi:hypothetical protein